MSSALRVKAKVFQWVKKALSIVRKNNLKKWKFLNFRKCDKKTNDEKEEESRKPKPPGKEEKIEVPPCESLGEEKVDRLN